MFSQCLQGTVWNSCLNSSQVFSGQFTSLSMYIMYSFLQPPKRKCCHLVSRLMLFSCLRKCLDTDQLAVALLFHWKHPLFQLFSTLSKHKPFLRCWWKRFTFLPSKWHGLVEGPIVWGQHQHLQDWFHYPLVLDFVWIPSRKLVLAKLLGLSIDRKIQRLKKMGHVSWDRNDFYIQGRKLWAHLLGFLTSEDIPDKKDFLTLRKAKFLAFLHQVGIDYRIDKANCFCFVWIVFGFWLTQKLLGKLKFRGRLALVLPWYIICNGRNSPDKEITNVKVILCLSVKPLMLLTESLLLPWSFDPLIRKNSVFDQY